MHSMLVMLRSDCWHRGLQIWNYTLQIVWLNGLITLLRLTGSNNCFSKIIADVFRVDRFLCCRCFSWSKPTSWSTTPAFTETSAASSVSPVWFSPVTPPSASGCGSLHGAVGQIQPQHHHLYRSLQLPHTWYCVIRQKVKVLLELNYVFDFVSSEPDFSYLDALAPYQPLAMKCVYCPIDTRLNFHQVSKLLKEVQVSCWLITIPFPDLCDLHCIPLQISQNWKKNMHKKAEITPTMKWLKNEELREFD